jgi:hypothetical protein
MPLKNAAPQGELVSRRPMSLESPDPMAGKACKTCLANELSDPPAQQAKKSRKQILAASITVSGKGSLSMVFITSANCREYVLSLPTIIDLINQPYLTLCHFF